MTAGGAPIAVQLYTLREEAGVDFRGVLARLGEIGYVGVELAGFHDLTPREFASAAADAGLVVASAHVPLGDGFEAALDVHRGIGCTTAVVPFLPPDAFADLDGIARSADSLARANDAARERDMALGYHNHWWELERVIDGRPALLHLFDRLPPDVRTELDIYWAKVGGSDPAALIGELGARVRLLHVKDGPADDRAKAMVAVGSGAIDVAGALGAASSAEWHIVELDRCDTDMFDAVEGSLRFLVGSGLSRGRA